MRRVLVEPIGVTVEVAEGRTLLDAITNAAVSVPTDCHGRGICGKCLVRLGTGEVTPPTPAEVARLSPRQLQDGWRLACQTTPLSDKVSIEVQETGGRRQILTASKLHHGAFHPAVTKTLVEFPRPSLDDARSDADRLLEVFPHAELPLSVLRLAPRVLRQHGWRALVTQVWSASRRHRAARCGPRRLRRRRRHRHVQDRRATSSTSPSGRQIDQEAIENPADALRRGCRHADHAGHGRAASRSWRAARARASIRRPAAAVARQRHLPPQPLRHDRRRQHGHAPSGPRHLADGLGARPSRRPWTSLCSCALPSWRWP